MTLSQCGNWRAGSVAEGHSRPGRASSRSSHVRYASESDQQLFRDRMSRWASNGLMRRSKASHSITSSASASSVGGISRPSAFAVFRLMTNSNLVDCMTGRSASFSPLRTRPVAYSYQ